MAVRSVCTTHARHAAPAGRAVRRPPPHPSAMPGTAAHPGCKPRFAARRPSRRLAFAGALLRLCVVAGSALLLLAALRFMAGDLAFLSLVPVGLPAPQVSGNGRAGLPLEVAPVLQNPELPNGCEAASLAALLKYKGVPADKLDLAYGYIPRGDIEETTDGRTGPDPELAYAGDPAAGLGFYCFAQPVAQGANAYLAAQGSALRAVDITGVTGQGLLQYLRGGDPVIVWITKDLSAPRTGGCTWLLADTGETYVPYANLHCVVLAGWDGDTCTIADPLQGRRRVDAAAFLQCFRQMGSRAVVVH